MSILRVCGEGREMERAVLSFCGLMCVNPEGSTAHEHLTTRSTVCRVAARTGQQDDLGLATVSPLQGDGHVRLGELYASSLELGRATGSACAAASLQPLQTDLQ